MLAQEGDTNSAERRQWKPKEMHLGVPAGIAVKHVQPVQHVEVVNGALAVQQERALIHLVVGRAAAVAVPPADRNRCRASACVIPVPLSTAPQPGGQQTSDCGIGSLVVLSSMSCQWCWSNDSAASRQIAALPPQPASVG